MMPETCKKPNREIDSRGFTVVEVLVVVGFLAILIGIATLSIRNMRPSLDSKQAATTLVNTLREARSKAMASNYQYRVDFNVTGKAYQMWKGSQAYNTPNTPASNWTVVPGFTPSSLANSVVMTSGSNCNTTNSVYVKFNANGTALLETPLNTAVTTPVTVCFQGGSGAKQYRIFVSPTGFVTLQ